MVLVAKKVSDETKMKNSHDRIDRVFNWAENDNFSISGKGALQDSTYDGYREKTHTLYNKYNEMYGVTEIWKVDTEKMMDIIKEEYGNNAYSIKGYTHAANFFSKASGESKVFKEPVNFVDMKDMQHHFETNNIERHASDSTVLKATHEDCEKVIKEIENGRSPFKEQAVMAIECGRRFGTRIDGALGLRAQDITINSDGSATIYLCEKGNLERWVDVVNPDDVAYAKELKESVKYENHTVIPPLTNQSGKDKGRFMDRDSAAERIAKVVGPAAERAGLSNPDKKDEPAFSVHAARKTFCQTRVDEYSNYTKEELREELERRMEEREKLQEEIHQTRPGYNITSFREKYETAKNRINYNSDGTRRNSKERDLNKKELCFLLTSFDSGHFRVDVLRYYAEYYPPTK